MSETQTSKAPEIAWRASSLRQLPEKKLKEFFDSLTDTEAALLDFDWSFWARDNQIAPDGDWVNWLILAGRGFGKTRSGAEWVRDRIERGVSKRVALVGPTAADVRDVMIEGESGLLNICPPWNRPKYEPSKRKLTWPNGALAYAYSAEEPERLRGPQHDATWADELCAWKYPDATWDMLMFGLRLGFAPQACITTTPKPTTLLKQIISNKKTTLTQGTTYDNLENLAGTFKDSIISRYEGTRLGRQELMAEILEDIPGALWSRGLLDETRYQLGAKMDAERIVVAIDPPITSTGDECGIVGAGVCGKHGYVLADRSEGGLSPAGWAKKAIALYYELEADRIIIEANQGGAMCESVLRQVDPSVPITAVHATRGKVTRAEPVAALYEQRRVHHIGSFPVLEDQMCAFTSDFDRAGMGYSPDRVDALVWAMTALMLETGNEPQIRTL